MFGTPCAAHTMASSFPGGKASRGFSHAPRLPHPVVNPPSSADSREALVNQILGHQARPLRGAQLGVVGEEHELDPVRQHCVSLFFEGLYSGQIYC